MFLWRSVFGNRTPTQPGAMISFFIRPVGFDRGGVCLLLKIIIFRVKYVAYSFFFLFPAIVIVSLDSFQNVNVLLPFAQPSPWGGNKKTPKRRHEAQASANTGAEPVVRETAIDTVRQSGRGRLADTQVRVYSNRGITKIANVVCGPFNGRSTDDFQALILGIAPISFWPYF